MLYLHQKKILEQNPLKTLIAFAPGSGKTICAIKLIDQNDIKNCLVVTPKSIREQFEEEIKKFSESKTNYKVITKEELRRDWKDYKDIDGFIFDEVHAHCGYTNTKKQSLLYKATIGIIRNNKPKCLYLMTGTPYTSSPMSIYALANMLGKDWKYNDFRNYFFDMVNFGGKFRYPIPVVKKGIENDIGKLVKRLGVTAKLEDLFDVPAQVYKIENFYLTAEQKKAIKELEDEGIARFTKLHCIENGLLKGDGYTEDKYFKSEKTQRVIELCEQHKKIAIVARYNLQLSLYKELLEKDNRKVFVINGKMKDKNQAMKEIDLLDDCVVLVQTDTCAGYNMGSVPVMVFASYGWSLVSYTQVIARIQRANNLKKNLYISLVLSDKSSIDYRVYDNVFNKKQDFMKAIYA